METKRFDEWVLPAHEEHLPVWMAANNDRRDGRLTYQAHKYDAVMKRVTDRRTAIDVGGHTGMWSWLMAKDFGQVIAFEPVALHRHCFIENTKDYKNVIVLPYALGAADGRVAMKTWTPDSTGDTGVDCEAIAGEIEMKRLDDVVLGEVGLIKIDCEGYELPVVQGAAGIIRDSKPIIIVEQKGTMCGRYGFKLLAAVQFLESLGMKQRDIISGDFIMDWPA